MLDRFLEEVISKIREEVDNFSRACSDGTYKTLEEFKYANGVVRGLKVSEHIVKELYKLWLSGGDSQARKEEVDAKKFEFYSSP